MAEITVDFPIGRFDHLSGEDKKDLLTLFSMVSEKSYRRGFQHGDCIPVEERTMTPEELRFGWSLSKSPCIDGSPGHTAIERLFMEFYELTLVGFIEFKF